MFNVRASGLSARQAALLIVVALTINLGLLALAVWVVCKIVKAVFA